jgi:ClpP class serine protease
MSATPTDRLGGFPRTSALPAQSPLYWVEQKNRYLRQLLIRDIEELTSRRLIVYFANRYEVGSDIQPRDVAHFAELLGDLNAAPVDLLVETSGGLTDATEALISLIRTTITDLRVAVVNAAKSNGTLLALSARSIVMGATSELGPIEPPLSTASLVRYSTPHRSLHRISHCTCSVSSP